jgi:hypothetical protein
MMTVRYERPGHFVRLVVNGYARRNGRATLQSAKQKIAAPLELWENY